MSRICVMFFILSTLLLTSCEPIGPIPGTRLDGKETALPDNWTSLDSAEVIQLATYDDYSVNLWGVAADQSYYVASSRGPESNWASRIAKDNQVRLRVDDKIYLVRAVEVSEDVELEEVRAAFKRKYDLDADADFPDAVVFRMDPRE